MLAQDTCYVKLWDFKKIPNDWVFKGASEGLIFSASSGPTTSGHSPFNTLMQIFHVNNVRISITTHYNSIHILINSQQVHVYFNDI